MKKKIIYLLGFVLIVGLGFAWYKGYFDKLVSKIYLSFEENYQINTGKAEDFVSANNKFGIDLYHYLGKTGKYENIFFSPISIESDFAMLYEGIDGEIQKAMEDVLHFPGKEKTRGGVKKFFDVINKHSKDYQLWIANAIWFQKDFPILKSYINNVAKYYYGELHKVDFKNDPEDAVNKINNWTSEKTNRKINKILDVGDITPETKLVLTNAIYFSGAWAIPFNKKDTEKKDFYLLNGGKEKVNMMYNLDDYRYGENGYLKILEMPYVGDLSMIVILPKEKDGIKDIEKKLTYKNLKKWLSLFKPGVGDDYKVKVWFPKFKVKQSFNLKNVLSRMGLGILFNRHYRPKLVNSLYKAKVEKEIHKTYIDVNEKRTEAAAVTAIGVEAITSCAMPITKEPKIYEFKADHPFIFLIKDNRTGAILFMGRILDPNKVE